MSLIFNEAVCIECGEEKIVMTITDDYDLCESCIIKLFDIVTNGEK